MNDSERLATKVKSGWSQSGQMRAGVAASVVTLQANFRPDYSETFTVQFGIQNNGPGIFAEAEIRLSVEGNTLTRRVTVGNGMSLTGVANAVNITVNDRSVTGEGGATAGQAYEVTCIVTRGNRSSTSAPPFLIPLETSDGSTDGPAFTLPPAGGQVEVDIPLDAGVTQLFVNITNDTSGNPVDIGTALVELRTTQTVKTWDPAQSTGWNPVTPGATTVRVTNNNATDAYTVSFTYGIDG